MRSQTVDELENMKHGVLIYLGSGKQGKSSALFSTVERFWPNEYKSLIETYKIDPGIFPGYHLTSNLASVPCDSVAVIEDAGRIFSARGSQNQTLLSRYLPTISHLDVKVLISVQSTSILDMDFFRTQRVLFMHKLVWDTDLKFERSELQELQVTANLRIREAMINNPGVDYRSFTYCSDYDEVLSLPLVPWWSDRQSHFLREAIAP